MTDRTHGPFKVGDVCLIVWAKDHAELVGVECTVVDGFGQWKTNGKLIPGYRVDIPGVKCPVGKWLCEPSQLRLRPPKSDQSQWIREATTTWDKCDWRPSGVVA